MGEFDFRALGALEVARGGDILALGGPKQRAVLAVLLAEAGQPVASDTIIDRIWGENAPRTAAKSVQKYVSQLRNTLGADRIEHRSGYLLVVARDECDLFAFEDRLGEAEAAPIPEARVAHLDQALSLWRGQPFADVNDIDDLAPLRARYSELWLTATEDRHDALLSLGHAHDVVASTESLIAGHPLRERLWYQRILALSRTGRQADALRAYQEIRSTLADELGIDPSAELQELERSVLLQEERSRWGARQVSTLPAPATSVVGREQEISAVRSLLERSRLVTVVGVGGTGKTTLAIEVARLLAAGHSDDVWFIELAAVTTSGDVASAAAAVLGLSQREGRPVEQVVADFFSGTSALIVFDNCEHVLGPTASLIAEILRRAPSVTVLATSRETLAMGQEVVFRLDPLAVPPTDTPAEEVAQFDAVALLIERARDVNPALETTPRAHLAIAAIARRLDGLPLAIELAAAQLRILSPTELRDQLKREFTTLTSNRRDIAERHRSIEAAIGWSHQLLDDDHRNLFEQLAVFRGGFAMAAVAAVCDLPRLHLISAIGALVDCSLISMQPREDAATRYHLLEPVREFAEQRLRSRNQLEAVEQRHGAWVLTLVETASRELKGPNEADAARQIDEDFANVRAAQLRAIERGELDTCLGVAVALHDYAYSRLRDEVHDWTHKAISLEQAEAHPLFAEAAGSFTRGLLNRGEQPMAMARAEKLVERYGVDDVRSYHAFETLATGSVYLGRQLDGVRFAEAAYKLALRTGDRYDQSYSYLSIVLAHEFRGDHQAAAEALVTSRELATASENPTQIAWSLYAASEVQRHDSPERALELLREAIHLAVSVGSNYVLGITQLARTKIEASHGSPDEALRSFEWLIEHWRRGGDWAHLWNTMLDLVDLLHRVDDPDGARQLRDSVEAVMSTTPGEHLASPAASIPASTSRDEVVALAADTIRRHLQTA